MSRQRSYLTTDIRRLRNDYPVFQASDAEIQSDLNKLKYVKKLEPVPEIVIKQELPKKRKAPVDQDKYVIEGLIKLQSAKVPEVKKKVEEVVEKKTEIINNQQNYQQMNWMNVLAFRNQFMMNNFLMPQGLAFIPNYSFQSSADRHLRIAMFTQNFRNSRRE